MTFATVEALLRELTDTQRCPWCGGPLRGPVCTRCRIDLSGAAGRDLADRCQQAAEVLRERQATLWTIRHQPTGGPAAPPQAPSPVRAPDLPGCAATPASLAPRLTEASLPAVFGVVGATLVAVAGLVFAYSGLIADPAVRRTVLVLVTLGVGAATLVLHRRGFGSSASAVGGLTAVLGLIAVHLVTGTVHGSARSVALAVAGVAWAGLLAWAGRRLRLRAWSGAGLVIAPVAVATLGNAGHRWTEPAPLAVALALLLAVVAAAGCAVVERRWRSSGRHTVESVTLTVEAAATTVAASVFALVGSVELLDAAESAGQGAPGAGRLALPGLTFVGLGLAAVVLGRLRPGRWTWVAGTYLVGGAGWTTLLLVATVDDVAPLTVFGAVVVTTTLTWAALSLVATRLAAGSADATASERFRSLLAGGWLVTAVLVMPLLGQTLGAVGAALVEPFGGSRARSLSEPLVNPDWTNGWLPTAWLTLGLVWAWYAALPRAVTSRRFRLPGAQRPDADDVLVVVGHPRGDTEVSLATWVETRPEAGVLLRSARLRSTGDPVPLGQIDDPWRHKPASLPASVGALAPVGVGAALGTVGLITGLPLWVSQVVWLVSAGLVWAVDRTLSRHPTVGVGEPEPGPWFTRFAVRPGLWVSGLGLLVLAAASSWWSRPAALAVGLVVVVTVVAWSRQAVSAFRPLLVGIAYAYALVVAGFALAWYPWGWTASWPATAGVLAVVSAAVALVLGRTHRQVGHPVYFTMLAVGAVPWLLAVTTMLDARTWWAAGACTAVLAVEAAVLSSGRRPQPAAVRILATVGLVPTAAAIAINVTPQVTSGSGAPVVLPVVAVLAVAAAVVAEPWAAHLAARQMTARLAARIRTALEASALGTVVVAELLAVVRPSAGAGISLAVCAITGAGAVYLATRPDRRPAWVLAWLAWSGVLWSALAWGDVGLVEAYTAPPGIVATVVAAWTVARRPSMARLAGAGLLLALAPTWVLLAAGQAMPVRAAVLTAAAGLLGLAATVVHRSTRPDLPDSTTGAGSATRNRDRRTLLPYAAAGTLVAGLGPILLVWHGLAAARATASCGGTRFGDTWFAALAHDLSQAPAALFLVAVGLTLFSAGLAAWAGLVAGWSVDPPSRVRVTVMTWRFAPAAVLAALGPAVAAQVLDRDDVPALGWALATAWLVGALLVSTGAVAARRRADSDAPTGLVPAWLLWILAFVAVVPLWVLGVASVEWYALPYGAAMVVTGLALTGALPRTRLTRWVTPRHTSSHATLALTPGVVAVLAPSTLTLMADPATWRAIMLILLALGFMLLGARRMWKALLGLGIADMAVVVVVVFATAQVSTTPWLITLLATGGLLLTLAVYAERRRNAFETSGR